MPPQSIRLNGLRGLSQKHTTTSQSPVISISLNGLRGLSQKHVRKSCSPFPANCLNGLRGLSQKHGNSAARRRRVPRLNGLRGLSQKHEIKKHQALDEAESQRPSRPLSKALGQSDVNDLVQAVSTAFAASLKSTFFLTPSLQEIYVSTAFAASLKSTDVCVSSEGCDEGLNGLRGLSQKHQKKRASGLVTVSCLNGLRGLSQKHGRT